MKLVLTTLAALALTSFGIAPTAQASEVTFNPKRTVEVVGSIRPGMAKTVATRIHSLTKQDASQPIDIFINSYGGGVAAGAKIIDAMDTAKYNGVTIRCAVGIYAMSMAFSIFANCDERYALAHTDLMFHPARVFTRRPILSQTMVYWAGRLERINRDIRGTLLASMDMDEAEFDYHFAAETIWPARVLQGKIKLDWLRIVKDIKGVNSPYKEPRSRGFFGRKSKTTPKEVTPKDSRIGPPDSDVIIIAVPSFLQPTQ